MRPSQKYMKRSLSTYLLAKVLLWQRRKGIQGKFLGKIIIFGTIIILGKIISQDFFSLQFSEKSLLGRLGVKKEKRKTFVLARSVPRGAVQGDLQLSCGEADQNVEGDQHRVYSLWEPGPWATRHKFFFCSKPRFFWRQFWAFLVW